MTDTPYTKITSREAFDRDLHHGGVEERIDTDGIRRAYHQASLTYWVVEVEFDPDDATAQDVLDALRIVIIAQDDGREFKAIAEALIDYAPETTNDHGLDLIQHMIVEGQMKLVMRP